jgi:hypothetical protein
MYPLAASDCSRSDTVFVLLMRNRRPISRMLGWYVFSLKKSSR